MKIKKILNRFYVHDMNEAVKFYEELLNVKCGSRIQYPEANLELAEVGDILILCGSDEALKPFKDTKATFLVDSIMECREFLLSNGAVIVRDLKEVPTGINMTVKHSDGNIVEYVEFKN